MGDELVSYIHHQETHGRSKGDLGVSTVNPWVTYGRAMGSPWLSSLYHRETHRRPMGDLFVTTIIPWITYGRHSGDPRSTHVPAR